MQHLQLTVEVVTPAFLSGADQQSVELRAASVKGELRWWWRALQNPRLSREILKRSEGSLFGSAELKLRSPIRLEVFPTKLEVYPKDSKAFRSGWKLSNAGKSSGMDPLQYLAFGPVGFKGKLVRPALLPGSVFTIRISWGRGGLGRDELREIVRALAAMFTLGGLGSRSRKGYGALEGGVEKVSTTLFTLDEVHSLWESQVKDVLKDGAPLTVQDSLPSWTSLEYRRIWLLGCHKEWHDALAEAGHIYKRLRPSAKNPQLGWLGGSASPRRASPLLVTVRRTENGYQGILALLPARHGKSPEKDHAIVEFEKRFTKERSANRKQ